MKSNNNNSLNKIDSKKSFNTDLIKNKIEINPTPTAREVKYKLAMSIEAENISRLTFSEEGYVSFQDERK